MNKITLLIIALLVLVANVNAQQMKVDKTSKSEMEMIDLSKEAVAISNVILLCSCPMYWDVDYDCCISEFYEVTFIKEGKKWKSLFSKSGKYIQTKSLIKEEEFPKQVMNSFKLSNYANWLIIGEKEKIKKPESEVYLVIVQNGKEKNILLFDHKGKLISIKQV